VTFNPAGSYAVDDLKPDTLYRFSLAARSDMGLGVYTKPIEARTAQSSEYTILLPCAVALICPVHLLSTNQWFRESSQPA